MGRLELDNLVRARKLKAEPAEESEIRGLLRSGQRRLKDAALPGLSLEGLEQLIAG